MFHEQTPVEGLLAELAHESAASYHVNHMLYRRSQIYRELLDAALSAVGCFVARLGDDQFQVLRRRLPATASAPVWRAAPGQETRT